MLHTKKNFLKSALAVFCMVSMLLFSSYNGITTVYAASGYEYVLLTKYTKTMKFGDEYYLTAITSTGKKPKFSSSDSTVASVNTYGKITAKKAGNATITAKIANGEASCRVTVEKTVITLSQKFISLENGYTARLKAETSTGHPVTYKSARSSIASVDENGVITAKKPGETTITVTADKTAQTCKVTVKQPTVRLDRTSASLYRKGTLRLSVSSTSKSIPRWKTNKKSVAAVDNEGKVTAIKNGTAIITVTVDGVSKTCEVTVKKPKITVGQEQISLAAGETCQPKVTVSSGNKPEYYSSNTNVATVNLCERRWHEGTHDSNCQRKIKLQEAEQNYGLYDRQSADHNQRDNQRKILMMHIYNDIIEHRQYSVYTSKNSLTTYGIVDLMEKLSQKLPWLYLCMKEEK